MARRHDRWRGEGKSSPRDLVFPSFLRSSSLGHRGRYFSRDIQTVNKDHQKGKDYPSSLTFLRFLKRFFLLLQSIGAPRKQAVQSFHRPLACSRLVASIFSTRRPGNRAKGTSNPEGFEWHERKRKKRWVPPSATRLVSLLPSLLSVVVSLNYSDLTQLRLFFSVLASHFFCPEIFSDRDTEKTISEKREEIGVEEVRETQGRRDVSFRLREKSWLRTTTLRFSDQRIKAAHCRAKRTRSKNLNVVCL